MVLAPMFRRIPGIISDAVAVPAVPERLEEPSKTPPSEKLTEPTGVVVPELAFTVAVTVVDDVINRLAGLTVTVVVVPVVGRDVHCVTRLYTSAEPSPVARS